MLARWNPGALVVDRANVDEITARQRDEESRRKWFDARVEQQLAHPSSYLSPLSAAT